jgi:hypothetical protein
MKHEYFFILTEQSSYSAMLNIPESVPPPESIPSIPGITELNETGIGGNRWEFHAIPELQLSLLLYHLVPIQ